MSKYYKFGSGLTLFYTPNKINKSTSIEISFDCGARCDEKLFGLSHFCEHMFFTGTDKLNKQQVSKRYFDFINVNAFTSLSDICFVGSVMSSKLKDYLLTVQDMICNSTFTKEAVEAEKKVVIQEIAQDCSNISRQAGRMDDYELHGHEYRKYGALGTKETVNQITSRDVKNYVKKYFVNNNCYISVCSALSFNKIKSMIECYFERNMPVNNLKPLPYKETPMLNIEKVARYTKDIEKNFVTTHFKFNKCGPDIKYRAIMDIMCNMIGDFSDGLTKELRIDNSLVYGAYARHTCNKVGSQMFIHTECTAENIKPCIDIMSKYIKNKLENGFTKEEFDKAIGEKEYYYQTDVITPRKLLVDLTRYRFYGKFINEKDLHLTTMAITLQDINNTLRELWENKQIQMTVYGNATAKDVYTIKQLQKKFK